MGIRSEIGKHFDRAFSRLFTGLDYRLHPSSRFHLISGIPEKDQDSDVEGRKTISEPITDGITLFDAPQREFRIIGDTNGDIFNAPQLNKNGKDKTKSPHQ